MKQSVENAPCPQTAQLKKQIDTQRRGDRTNIVEEIKSLMVLQGVTGEDFGMTTGLETIKYRNTTVGDSWRGRRLKAVPKERSKKIDDFAV